MKIVWYVSPAPTGPFRSFHKRGWPMGYMGRDGQPAFRISCDDDYTPARGRGEEDHAPLYLLIAFRKGHDVGFTWRRLTTRSFSSLDELKGLAQRVFDDNPSWFVNS